MFAGVSVLTMASVKLRNRVSPVEMRDIAGCPFHGPEGFRVAGLGFWVWAFGV